MLHLVNRNRKNIPNKKGKKKKRSKRQCNTRRNISACPKNPRKKIIQKELSRCVTKERTIELEAKDSREWLEMVIIIIIIIIGRSN